MLLLQERWPPFKRLQKEGTRQEATTRVLKGQQIENFSARNSYVYHKERIYVSHISTINDIIKQHHDDLLMRHKE